MGNSVPSSASRVCCIGSAGDLSAAMDMVSVENALTPCVLEEMRGKNRQEDDEVDVDYDAETLHNTCYRSKAQRAVRRAMLNAACADDAPGMLHLVAEGADLKDVEEAMRLAAYRGSSCVVRELVAVGISVNERCPRTGLTSLQLAANSGHLIACELLLDALADVHGPGARGPTAILLARKNGHSEVEEAIERHCATILLSVDGKETEDAGGMYRRAHVLPRVSPVLSQAVLQTLPMMTNEILCPAEEALKEQPLAPASPWREGVPCQNGHSNEMTQQVMPL